jgi:hypothetical protein
MEGRENNDSSPLILMKGWHQKILKYYPVITWFNLKTVQACHIAQPSSI